MLDHLPAGRVLTKLEHTSRQVGVDDEQPMETADKKSNIVICTAPASSPFVLLFRPDFSWIYRTTFGTLREEDSAIKSNLEVKTGTAVCFCLL